jgi:photosystem II stability/assembly factor-like uncharacterized protein
MVVGGRVRALAVITGVMLTACGSHEHRRAPPRPASRVAAFAAFAACRRSAHLKPGTAFGPWRMGAVHFLSPSIGVGLTAAVFPCYKPVGPRGVEGVEGVEQSAPARLALSRDGGRDWYLAGTALPVAAARSEGSLEQVVATSVRDVWALSGGGQLVATTDGGVTWTAPALPRPVVQLAISGGWVWALACPATGRNLCRPELGRARASGGRWTRLAMPRTASAPDAQLAIAPGAVVVSQVGLFFDAGSGRLIASVDDGGRWTVRLNPAWRGYPCTGVSDLAAARHAWWLLCLGGAAAGSSTKGLLRTRDGGRTWTTVSEVTSLAHPSSRGSISAEEPGPLVAASPTRLWLALTNGLSESADGGSRWTYVTHVDPEGAPTTFDVLTPTVAWLLAPGTGLWRTTDGSAWRVVP